MEYPWSVQRDPHTRQQFIIHQTSQEMMPKERGGTDRKDLPLLGQHSLSFLRAKSSTPESIINWRCARHISIKFYLDESRLKVFFMGVLISNCAWLLIIHSTLPVHLNKKWIRALGIWCLLLIDFVLIYYRNVNPIVDYGYTIWWEILIPFSSLNSFEH